jgi:acetate kinase
VREQVCERLAFLGVAIDAARNAAASGDCDVSAADVRVRVVVVRAREEIVAARAARALLRDGERPPA